MLKHFFGTCVDNPFDNYDELSEVIDNAREISKRQFLIHCNVENDDILYGLNMPLKKQFKEWPNDFAFYVFENNINYEDIYFFTHSAIEHFYK